MVRLVLLLISFLPPDDPGHISASAWKPRFEHAFTRNSQRGMAIAITGYKNGIYKTAVNILRLIEAETPAGLHDDSHSVFKLPLQTSSRPLVEPAPSSSTTAQLSSSTLVL